MKKLLSVLFASALLLSACGSKKEDNKKVIRIAVEKSYLEYYNEAAKAFTEGKDFTIKVEEAKMFDVLDALETQKGNSADLFMLPNDRIGDLANKALIKPLDTKITDYTDNALAAAEFNGKTYMLPISTDTTLLFYNKDLVKEEPKTLGSLDAKDFAAKFTDFYFTAGMFYSNGGYIFKDGDPTQLGLNNEGSVAAGKAIQKLYASGAEHWELMKDDTIAYDTAMNAFYNGEVKYVINGPWAFADVEKAGVNFGVMPIPSWDGKNPYQPLVGTKGLAINAYSANTAEAEEFIAFLNNAEWATKWHEMTLEINPHVGIDYGKDTIYAVAFEATTLGQGMPTKPEFAKVWVPMADALKQIASGEDVQTALDAAVKIIETDIASMK